DVKRAGRFTRRRADASGELRKIVGRVQVARGFPPAAVVDEIVPVRNLVVDRTARRAGLNRAGAVAIGNAAIHAARGLVAYRGLVERNDEFPVVMHPLLHRSVAAVLARDLEKTRYLTHLTKGPIKDYAP